MDGSACGRFGALRPEDRRFELHSKRLVHVGTLDKSFTRGGLYDVMPCVAALRLSSTPVIASVLTLLVNILLYVRLYIKRK